MPPKFLVHQPESNPMRSLQSMFRRPTIFLGLGGTGCHSVSNIKQLYKKTFAGYAEEGKKDKIPAGIQFLGFDSAQQDCPKYLINGQEWIHLEGNVTPSVMKDMKSESYYRNWIPDIDSWDFAMGAGGKRTLGKILFTRNVTGFAKHLGAKLQTASSYQLLDDGTPTIYIFAGLAGGTGSGAILDACFYIRQNYPEAKIIGVLGVVGGERGKSPDIQRNATVGCYAALREINTFQDKLLRSKLSGEYADGKVFQFPVGSHHGMYTQPFDYVFLVGNKNQRGTANLNDAKSLTAFMARTAFMLTAYPADSAKGQRSFESEMCDRLGTSDTYLKGMLATYLVPGFGQLIVPRVLVTDYMTCTLGGRVAGSLVGGGEYDEVEYSNFSQRLHLTVQGIADHVGYDQSGNKITPDNWMEALKPAMENAQVRYSVAGKTEIISYGKGLGSTYLDNTKKKMADRADAHVKELNKQIWEEMVRCIKDPDRRIVGARDFLGKIRSSISNEVSRVAAKLQEEKGDGQRVIKSDWNAIKRLINDVCTDSGPIDRAKDRFNLNRALTQYVEFLDAHQASVQVWAMHETAIEVLSRVASNATDLESKLKILCRTLESSASLLNDEKTALAGKLLEIDEGAGSDFLTINGFNLLNGEWRENYLNSERRSSEALLGTMCAGAWDPSAWFDWLDNDKVHMQIADDIYDRMLNMDTSQIQSLSIADVFSQSKGEAGKSLAKLLGRYVSPQMRYSEMNSRYGERAVIGFIGNIDDDIDDSCIKNQEGLQSLSRAIAYEDDTICYLKVATQIALHGCDELKNRFDPTYESWKKKIKKQGKQGFELDWRHNHAFAGSDTDYDTWRLPTDIEKEIDNVTAMIGRAYAVSIMLEPEKFSPTALNDPEMYDLMNGAIRAMNSESRNPKDKRLGMFKIGKSNFWLCPFFDPLESDVIRSGASISYGFLGLGAPISLGGTLEVAKEAILRSEEHRETVHLWVKWFEENRSRIYTDKQLDEALLGVQERISAMKKRQARDSEDYGLWAAVATDILSTWRNSLL